MPDLTFSVAGPGMAGSLHVRIRNTCLRSGQNAKKAKECKNSKNFLHFDFAGGRRYTERKNAGTGTKNRRSGEDRMLQYQEVMEMFSQTGIGMAVVSEDGCILELSRAGAELLHCGPECVGKRLEDLFPEFRQKEGEPKYVCTAFGEYVMKCPAPEAEGLPEGAALLAFRPASADVMQDILFSILNRIRECVVLCDAEGRMVYLNDAAVRLDSMVTEDVRGRHVTEVYTMNGGEDFQIPLVIKERRSHLNMHQHYTTHYGKTVETMSNAYPAVQNGQVLGAFNILEDWSAIDQLNRQVVDLQEKLLAMDGEKKRKKSTLTARYRFSDIIHTGPLMRDVIRRCRQVAASDSSVMIYGETGTGKELLAQSIHNESKRANGPFLAINCAALPETLLESMLFGSERGAFTGAESRPGLLEQANGGTLLLDELNSMDISLQAKLLRFLQDGKIRRVGGTEEKKVDVRILSNLNMPPHQAIEKGLLRQDLFFRLGVVNITLPPLRERREDIPLLTKTFIMNCDAQLKKNIQGVDAATMRIFMMYGWPGNLRELQHAIEHAGNVLPDEAKLITPDDIPSYISMAFPADAAGAEGASEDVASGEQEKKVPEPDQLREDLILLLTECRGNITAAARKLGTSRQNLDYRLKKLGINAKELKQRIRWGGSSLSQ